MQTAGSQPFIWVEPAFTWVSWVKISVCYTHQIYPFETFKCSTHVSGAIATLRATGSACTPTPRESAGTLGRSRHSTCLRVQPVDGGRQEMAHPSSALPHRRHRSASGKLSPVVKWAELQWTTKRYCRAGGPGADVERFVTGVCEWVEKYKRANGLLVVYGVPPLKVTRGQDGSMTFQWWSRQKT